MPAAENSELVPVIVLGSSSGGLRALEEFFSELSPDIGAALIVIQHLDPTHASSLPEILSRHSKLPVAFAEHNAPLKANEVRIIPPGYLAAVDGDTLSLTPADGISERGSAIDTFLISLADSHRHRTVAILLSGSGNDGVLGLRAIKDCGGITIAQEPATADFPALPDTAIASGLVDHVLNPNNMRPALVAYLNAPMTSTSIQASNSERSSHFSEILATVKAQTGYDFTGYKETTLRRRIARRMALKTLANEAEYLSLLSSNPPEVRALFEDFLINVTNFFRDPEVFTLLESEIIPGIIKQKKDGEAIRIWVPACSTGEEAYSIAMVFAEQISLHNQNCQLQIFATDIDGSALTTARGGKFSEFITRDVSASRLSRFFTKTSVGYEVNRSLRDCVIFAAQNLTSDPPFSKLDLVSCRNLLIYLDPALQRRALELFHFALRKDGLLLLGSSETVQVAAGRFAPISRTYRLFQRISSNEPLKTAAVSFSGAADRQKLGLPTRRRTEARNRMSEVVEQVLLREVIPGSVLVNEDREILYLYGNVSSYLQLSGGEPSRKLEDLVPPTLRQRLKSALKTVTQERTRVSLDGMMVRDGVNRQLRLSVRPVVLENEHPCLSLVTFEELESSKAEATTPPQVESVLIAQLENELRATREDLQSTISDLETSNEELRSSHEEINSMNEELQSSNEELETSKEELQSLNEELTTVNAELQENVTMHEELSDDLSNLITSSGIATIFLDTDLRIKRFTTASCRIMNLIETDRGRSIGDVTKRFHDESIQLDCENVLRSRTPSEREIKLIDGSWFLQRILPYRSMNQTVEGVVITFTEITGVKRTEEKERLLAEKLAHGQKLEALGLLAGGVAHDFNNILTALMGHAELGGRDRDVGERTKQRFQGIVQAGTRAKELIRQILLFSRSDEEKKIIVNVSQVLKEALTLIRASIPATIQIQPSIEDSSLCILGDPARLHQVLMNLCTNASHAIGARPGRIAVALSALELLNEAAKDKALPPGRYLSLSVTDSGSGIPPELQPRIFEPFFTTKSQTGGTVMGLSVVHGIVTSLGGKIEVKSRVGEGSTFEIFLPRVGQSIVSQKPSTPPAVRRGTAHILLVDDEEAILSLVQELFEVSGYTVTAVGDPTVAKDLFTQNPEQYAILVTDQSMPKMTGVNLILALRAIRPDLPVILTSGFSADLTPDVMEQLGVHTFLSKPYQFAELEAVLATALTGRDETHDVRPGPSS